MSYQSRVYYLGDGSDTTFAVPFPYIAEDHVTVYVNSTLLAASLYTFTSPTVITFDTAPVAASEVAIIRATPYSTPFHTIQRGSINPPDINENAIQFLYALQEQADQEQSDVGIISTLLEDAIAAAGAISSITWDRPAASISASPGSPSLGDRVIVAAAGTSGVFIGHEDSLAQYMGATPGWLFLYPGDNQAIFIGDIPYRFDLDTELWSPEAFAPGSNAVGRTYRGKFRDIISALDYIPHDLHEEIRTGNDDAGPVNAYVNLGIADYLAYAPRGTTMVFPSGLYLGLPSGANTYCFDIPLIGLAGTFEKNFGILGQGRASTRFRSLIGGSDPTHVLWRARGGIPITNTFTFGDFRCEVDLATNPSPGGGHMPGGVALQLEDSAGSVFRDIDLYAFEQGLRIFNNTDARYSELTRIHNVKTIACYEGLIYDRTTGVGSGDPSMNRQLVDMDIDIKDGQRGIVMRNGVNVYHSTFNMKLWGTDTCEIIHMTDASIVQLSEFWGKLEVFGGGTKSLFATGGSYWHTNGWFVPQGTASAPTVPSTKITDNFGFGTETLPCFMFDRNPKVVRGDQSITPVLRFGGANGVTNYLSGRQTCRWRMDGDVVEAVYDMAIDTLGAATGPATVDLPFPAADILNPTISSYFFQEDMLVDLDAPSLQAGQNSSLANILINGKTLATNANFQSGATIQMGIRYVRKYG